MAALMESVSNLLSGTETKTNRNLRDLFVNGLNEMYGSEKKQVEVIDPQAESATTDEVRQAILRHGDETRAHVTLLEQAYRSIGVEPQAFYSNTTQGVADDTKQTTAHTEAGTFTRDASLLISGQKGEHYEIGVYSSLHAQAQTLGYTEAAQVLGKILSEEKAANETWVGLGESFVYQKSAQEGSAE